MRDAETYEDRVANCARALAEENRAEMESQLDAMSADELRSLTLLSQVMAVAARKAWLRLATRPSGG